MNSAEQMIRRESLARTILSCFLFTFLAARILVLLIMTRKIPDLYLHLGGNHVHHLNYGIFLLSIVGGLLLFSPQDAKTKQVLAGAYGVGLALTFDEFGMWLHLGGSYWQRASWDAVVSIAATLALIAFASTIKHVRMLNWWVALFLAVGLVVFSVLLSKSLQYAERVTIPKLMEIEASSPP